ncbi:DUF4386 domain-containing protein [Arthrobacter sp. RHLT1-20]
MSTQNDGQDYVGAQRGSKPHEVSLDGRQSTNSASVVAGLGLLLMAGLSGFAIFAALGGLGSPGDSARAAKAIAESEDLFRWGVASLLLVAVLDIVVAAALLDVFATVSRSLSTLAAWFRVAYAAVFLVAISQLWGVIRAGSDVGQVAKNVQFFDDIWHAGLILFGVHLVLIGYLAYRSGFAPKALGFLLVAAGLGYLVDGVGSVLVRGYSANVAQFTFVGEVVLIFWLLIKGRRVNTVSLESYV